MRLQLTPDGNVRATLQSRSSQWQSRRFCCEDGHPDVLAAAEHGAAAEVQDELSYWLGFEQPEIVTEQPAVKFDDKTGRYFETVEPVEPFVRVARPVHTFDRRLVEDKRYSHIKPGRKARTVDVLGQPYRIVYETAALVVGVRVGG